MKTRIKTRQQRQAHYYNKKARDLPPLEEGDVTRLRPFALNGKTWEKASVPERLDERSYQIETEDVTYRTNRVDLRKIPGENQEEIASHDVNPTSDCLEPEAARHPSLKPLVQHQNMPRRRQSHHRTSRKPSKEPRRNHLASCLYLLSQDPREKSENQLT